MPICPCSGTSSGQLQTNKVRSVTGYAEHVHSVDRLKLVGALGKGARRAGREVGVAVQVALDAELGEAGGRGGAAPEQVAQIADAVAAEEGLRLDGLMTVAPAGRAATQDVPGRRSHDWRKCQGACARGTLLPRWSRQA